MIRTKFLRFIAGVSGFVLTLLSVKLTASYGFTINFEMGIALGIVSFMAGYIFCIAYEVIQNCGQWKKFAAPAVIAIATTITLADVLTNASTVGYNKEVDLTSASDNERKIKLVAADQAQADKRVKEYEKAVVDIESANPWLANVTADGIMSQIRNLEGDRVYARSKQCANVTLPESRKFCDELTELRTRHAAAVKRNAKQEELAAARQALSRVMAQAQGQQLMVSAVSVQNEKLAGLFTISQTPDKASVYWVNTFMMVFFGMLITAASQFFNFVAWAGNIPGVSKPWDEVKTEISVSVQDKTDGAVAALRAKVKEMEAALLPKAKVRKAGQGASEASPEAHRTEPLDQVKIIERQFHDRQFAKNAVSALGDFRSRALARRQQEAA